MTSRLYETPAGMTRRHFMRHLVESSAMALPAIALTQSLSLNAATIQRSQKSAIMLWMSGGPASIDIWDLKSDMPTSGPFAPIATSGEVQICEHMPKTAQQMHHLAVIRSMSTREADHMRGRYYMHTGYVPNPSVEHPSYGAVVAHETDVVRSDLELPPFISIGGNSVGSGFLGMAYAPFVVGASGDVRNLKPRIDERRMAERIRLLSALEERFVNQNRGSVATDHREILKKTRTMMTSRQLDAFQVDQEPRRVQELYGETPFGRGCLMARRLVEQGVPFVEVDLGGWDTHANNFSTLETKLPVLDQAMSALIADLAVRERLRDTVVIWMGEFGRTPRINGNAGRDHWARSWSCVVGGGPIRGGIAVGQTSADGTEVETEPFTAEDLMASVCHAMGISLETTFTSKSGRPMKIAGGGKVIQGLFGA